jgi:hypothetical protein
LLSTGASSKQPAVTLLLQRSTLLEPAYSSRPNPFRIGFASLSSTLSSICFFSWELHMWSTHQLNQIHEHFAYLHANFTVNFSYEVVFHGAGDSPWILGFGNNCASWMAPSEGKSLNLRT